MVSDMDPIGETYDCDSEDILEKQCDLGLEHELQQCMKEKNMRMDWGRCSHCKCFSLLILTALGAGQGALLPTHWEWPNLVWKKANNMKKACMLELSMQSGRIETGKSASLP